MRYSTALLLCAALLGLASCGGDDEGDGTSTEDTTTTAAEAKLPQNLLVLEGAAEEVGGDELSRQTNECEQQAAAEPPSGTPRSTTTLACIEDYLRGASSTIEKAVREAEDAISALPPGDCRDQADALIADASAVRGRVEATIKAVSRVVNRTSPPNGSSEVELKVGLLRGQAEGFAARADLVATECA